MDKCFKFLFFSYLDENQRYPEAESSEGEVY